MVKLPWSSDRDSRFLAAGRPTTSSDTICLASLTCLTPVHYCNLFRVVVLLIQPRFFLTCPGDEYVLKMNVIDHVFDNMVVDEALVRIVLPEGASNIELETPYPVTRLPDTLHFTYLDVKGRPVVQLSAKNLVENHMQEFKVFIFNLHNVSIMIQKSIYIFFQLKYTFSKIVMLQEPLLCAAAFFVLFATFIVYARLDFSITKVWKEEKLWHKHWKSK